jgi:hypothetical protein
MNISMDNSVYMTDIVACLKTSIKYDVDTERETPVDRYMDNALSALKRRYRIAHQWDRYRAWSEEERNDLIQIWFRLQPAVIDEIEKLLKHYKQKKLTKEIYMTTAKAAIAEAMSEAGLRHRFTGQTYRAKVSVLLAHKKCITVYISYKKLHKELPDVIRSLKIIRDELETLGRNVSFNNARGITDFI